MRKKLLNLAAFAVLLTFPFIAAAFSDVELRERWSKSVSSVKKTECKDEPKQVHKLLDYASILIIHGEIEEARATLERAKGETKSGACGEAIDKELSAS